MDYENFCKQIMDADPKIRSAVVYDSWATRVGGGLREGLESLLSDHAEKELVNLSVINWQSRKTMAKVLGKTIYTLAEHDNVKRFSFYLGDDYMLLLSTQKDADTDTVVDSVIKIYHQNQ